MKFTGLILTYNGERLLEKAIRSLFFCDEILLVDSFSTDQTMQIISGLQNDNEFKNKIRVIQNKWPGPAKQFALAFSQINTDWVFSLDQDEICTPELTQSILEAFAKSNNDDLSGFFVPRASWYYDRFMRYSGWYPDYLLRVFNYKKMQMQVSGAHYSFKPNLATKRLRGDIIHYPYENFYQHLEKINDYAQKGAMDLRAKHKSGGLCKAILHGLARFFKLYFIKLGFLDGKAGFINAVHGTIYAFSKYLRVDENK